MFGSNYEADGKQEEKERDKRIDFWSTPWFSATWGDRNGICGWWPRLGKYRLGFMVFYHKSLSVYNIAKVTDF